MSRRREQQKLRGGAMVLSRPEILVSRAVKPRLVWRQLDLEEAPRRRHQAGTGLQTDALVPLQLSYLYIRSRPGGHSLGGTIQTWTAVHEDIEHIGISSRHVCGMLFVIKDEGTLT